MKLPKLIGVIHLSPLVGSPRSHGHHPAEILQEAGSIAVQEAQALVQAGFDGLIIENFGDTPFYKTRVPAETVASMSIIAAAVRDTVDIPVGINVLRNDAGAALAIAATTGCDFIRVNVLSGVAATDQGLIEGNGAALLRERDRLHAPVAILADVHVKHAQSLSSSSIALAIEEVGGRGMADGVIVTGHSTGRLVDMTVLREASQTARHLNIPLYLGSGATAESISEIRSLVDGVIVGSTLRKDGMAGAPLDKKRTLDFARQFAKLPLKKNEKGKAKRAEK